MLCYLGFIMVTPTDFIVSVIPWKKVDRGKFRGDGATALPFEPVQELQITKLENAITKGGAKITPDTRTYISHHTTLGTPEAAFEPLIKWATVKKGVELSLLGWRPYGTAETMGEASESGVIKILFVPAKEPTKKKPAGELATLSITWLPVGGGPAQKEELPLA